MLDTLQTIAEFIFGNLKTVAEFFIFYVLVRGVIAYWLAKQVRKHGRRYLLRTQREIAIWLHFRNKQLNKGHQCKFDECEDELCKIV